MELEIQRALACPTPVGRETPVPDYKVLRDEFPYIDNDASPVASFTPEVATKDGPMEVEERSAIKVKPEVKDEDMRTMESSAAEALISLAGQDDNIIR